MPDFELNEDGLMVATRDFLLRRGFCCGCGCRNCPYRGTAQDRRPPALRRDLERPASPS
ncbi:MAG TPA: DUF5522 domain-containing protein [Dehalococcoidia bacterium]|nr:DUF5522 domain-containing protein [Dehalococcoidia bacterium]